jgi:hypothetical protein
MHKVKTVLKYCIDSWENSCRVQQQMLANFAFAVGLYIRYIIISKE